MARKSDKTAVVETEDVRMSRSPSPESESGSESEVSNSEVESSSESGSESGSDEESSSEQPPKKVSFAAPKPYKAPFGFKTLKQQAPPKSSVSSLLSDLRGKQVLHITAPDYLPLSKIEEVSLAKIMRGTPVLKHKGVQYGIPIESLRQPELNGKALHLYDPKTKTYYSTTATDIPTYHIQELIDMPDVSAENSVLEAVKGQVKPPRKQPKNLKMRFRPVGSGAAPPETIGSSSEESEGEQPTFKVPRGVEVEREERKRKNRPTEGDNETQVGATPRKKSKKEAAEAEEKKKKSSKPRDDKKRKKAEKA
ncbi:hypothetical protein BO70DRAFT_358442 [Aspergillus heteromorphus CBS 117.55]|uniref:DNA-directed RNA polymerase I subunit RPA34.5 n=1 Tax=Aspergillus heteromorphus CBS 117.55 TaxID=1448321 RepID=A0A317WX81_9EURO|nr:uncharacterized protein BO70DRAFT_358442 [Aspergillus heteromorphus CBS 117.55]PWY91004.1 hypothetical protein BO70DRAFT_358442 [Aspergillus heteromorphus CBS 117.55]